MKNEVEVIKAEEFGLTQEDASGIERAFAPKISERKELEKQYSEIIALTIDKDSCKAARELRLKLVKTRTGIASIHKTQKAFFLAAGKFVDAWKNKETLPVEQMESELLKREKHFENIEKERIEALNNERTNALIELGSEYIPAGLAQMEESVWESFLAGEVIKRDARIAEEKRVEAVRVAKEKAEAEEREQIRLENEKLKAEAAEREKAETERAKKEAAERARERAEAEKKLIAERKAASEKLEQERRERERIEAEKAKIEAENKAKSDAEKAEKAAELARRKDKENRAKVNNAALDSLVASGIDAATAKKVVKAIASGKVTGVSISY